MSNHRVTNGRLKTAVALFALAFTSASSIAAAEAPAPTIATGSYNYQKVDYPGASQTIFWGLNDFGDLGGQFALNGGTAHAMVYRHGRFELLDTAQLGTYFSAAGGPNDLGNTYGAYADATDIQHGFVLSGKRFETEDFPGHLNSNVDGYNQFGTILGVYWDADGKFHGVVRHGRNLDTLFDVAGSTETYPLGINDLEQSVGYWDTDPAATHAFLREPNGKITSFDVPGAADTVAFGINALQQIGGYYVDTSGALHGFVETNGKYVSLDIAGSAGTVVTTINNLGVVAGEYFDAAGGQHGFVATPKPAAHN